MINKRSQILKMTQLAILIALVVVLQALGTAIKIGPLPMSLVLVPIVIGACLLGVKAGALLGFTFGLVTMIMGILAIDGFSNILWNANPFWFVFLCLLKATAAGFGSALVYKALGRAFKEKNKILQTVIASVCAPVINTGIFVVGMLLFFFDTASALPSMFPEAFGTFENAFQLVFIGLAGLNFVGEFVINLVLSPAIVRIVDIVNKKLKI